MLSLRKARYRLRFTRQSSFPGPQVKSAIPEPRLLNMTSRVESFFHSGALIVSPIPWTALWYCDTEGFKSCKVASYCSCFCAQEYRKSIFSASIFSAGQSKTVRTKKKSCQRRGHKVLQFQRLISKVILYWSRCNKWQINPSASTPLLNAYIQ